MKSFFSALFGRRPVTHTDSFALTRDALWQSIARAIKLQKSMNKSILLVAHFPETFTNCQTMLEQNGIDYTVETEPVSKPWLSQIDADSESPVRLLLADLVRPLSPEADAESKSALRIAVMVVERHPYKPKDDCVTGFAASLPARVEVGHFLALDDELVKRTIPPQMIELMRTMGLEDQELISSAMVTRRLKKLMQRTSETAVAASEAASAAEWYSLQSGESDA